MRLAILIDEFRAERGGTERYLAELATRLAAAGHEVRVYCREGRAPSAGVEVVRVAAPGLGRAERERAFARAASELARAHGCAPLLGIRHVLDVDVYQPHGGTWPASVEARLRSEPRAWRRRLRAAAHRLSPKHRALADMERELFARNPGLLTLAVSPLVKEDVLARYGAQAPRVEVLWPAFDRERVRSAATAGERASLRSLLGVRIDAPLLVFAAHDFELKGLAPAVEALARSDARRGATLLVAGRGSAARHAALARRRGVDVRFLGERGDVPTLLAAADLLLHPTHHDPCALVTLEALAAGVPVVTTRRNGAAALLEGGGGRVVDEPDEVGALGAAIDALLVEGSSAREAARAAVARLGWEEHLARLVPLLESARRNGRERAS
jgi:UDP-glucose:(heptosyl)LPS alpha-1,3-glucosyltransferase